MADETTSRQPTIGPATVPGAITRIEQARPEDHPFFGPVLRAVQSGIKYYRSQPAEHAAETGATPEQAVAAQDAANAESTSSLTDPESTVNKPFAAFRKGADRIADDLHHYADTHNVALGPNGYALFHGLATAMQAVPVKSSAVETAAAIIPPPELEGESLEGESLEGGFAKLGGKTVKSSSQGGHAGGGVASVEELNRPGRFVKVSKSGMMTDQGKTPDFNLRNGEVGYQVKPDGSFEVKDGQETPTHKTAIQQYAKTIYPSKVDLSPAYGETGRSVHQPYVLDDEPTEFVHGTTPASAAKIRASGKFQAPPNGPGRNYSYSEFGPDAVYAAPKDSWWMNDKEAAAGRAHVYDEKIPVELHPDAKIFHINSPEDATKLAKIAGFDNVTSFSNALGVDNLDATDRTSMELAAGARKVTDKLKAAGIDGVRVGKDAHNEAAIEALDAKIKSRESELKSSGFDLHQPFDKFPKDYQDLQDEMTKLSHAVPFAPDQLAIFNHDMIKPKPSEVPDFIQNAPEGKLAQNAPESAKVKQFVEENGGVFRGMQVDKVGDKRIGLVHFDVPPEMVGGKKNVTASITLDKATPEGIRTKVAEMASKHQGR